MWRWNIQSFNPQGPGTTDHKKELKLIINIPYPHVKTPKSEAPRPTDRASSSKKTSFNMTISMLLGVWLGVSGSGSFVLGYFTLVCGPSGWILRPYVQGAGLPVDDRWHMVLGPGRFQLSRFWGGSALWHNSECPYIHLSYQYQRLIFILRCSFRDMIHCARRGPIISNF